MLPVACLLATLFTLSNLNKNSELIALFSLGQSLARVSAPVLVLVGGVSVLSFWMSDKVIPTFTQKKNYIYYTEMKKMPGLYSTVKKNKIWYRSENILFNIKTLNAEAGKAQGITLYYFDSAWTLTQLITAQDVLMSPKSWELSDGKVTLFAKENSFPISKEFKTKKVRMMEDLADIKSTNHSADVMSVEQLKRFISKNKKAGLDTLRYEVEYQGKFAFAFAGLVLALIGIPFSTSHERQGGGVANIGVCMLLAFGYWILFSSSLTMGKNGYLPPLISAWGPNVFMAAAAYYFLLKQKK